MGSSHSSDNTVLGRSIINDIYKSKVPVGLSTSDRGKYYISEWRDRQSLSNPDVGQINIKLDDVKFVIRDTEIYWNFETGTSLSIGIEILEDISINADTPIAQAIEDPIYRNMDTKCGSWKYTKVGSDGIHNSLRSLFNEDNTIIRLQGVRARISGYTFGDKFKNFQNKIVTKYNEDNDFFMDLDKLEYLSTCTDSGAMIFEGNPKKTTDVMDDKMKLKDNPSYVLVGVLLLVFIVIVILLSGNA
jgi:hypothetical protein